MRVWLLVCTIGFWGLLLIDPSLFWAAGALYMLFLLLRFRTILPVLLFGVLMGIGSLSLDQTAQTQPPAPGLYRVTEIRNHYVLAANEEHQVMVQNLEAPNFGQIYHLEDFEEVYSLHNTGLFYFAGWLQDRQIYWTCQAGSAQLVRNSDSMQARLFSALRKNPTACYFLYNLKPEDSDEASGTKDQGDNWVSSLGLPVLGAVHLLEERLTRRLDSRKSYWICTVVLLLYGHFFCWSLSLARVLIFRSFKKVTRWAWRWSLQVLTFLLLFPWAASQFTFVLPALIGLAYPLCPGKKWIRKAFSTWILAVLQIVFFGTLDFFSMIGFSLMRRMWGLLFWLEMGILAGLQIPVAGLHDPLNGLQDTLAQWSLMARPWQSWSGIAMFPVLILFRGLGVWMLLKPCTKRLLACWMGILFYMVSFYIDPCFHVYQIDIGQGDAALIVEPFQRSIVMIDAAGTTKSSQASSLILPFLRSRHLMHVDALILTHDDVDHAGSAEDLQELWDIRQVITDRSQEVPVDYPFYSLLPEREAEDDNDESIVNWFSYDGFSYLWTGDASTKVEGQLLAQYALSADVLKAGHHGSKTSSSQAFLEAVDPQLALISAGYQNRYGHPSPQVITRMHNLGIDTLQTAQVGMIHLFSWRGWMGVACADGTLSWMTPKNAGTHEPQIEAAEGQGSGS